MNNLLPPVGFGTWKFKNNTETTDILNNAIQCGYKLIDTASSYQNEEAIGNALSQHKRVDLLISGKLWNTDRKNVEAACDRTIQNLQCDYLDVFLVHWPASKAVHEDWVEINNEVWAQMEELVTKGKVKYIGVSNFKANQLQKLIEYSSIKPCVNQIEFHPGFMQQETVEYCIENGILVQAWSPLRSGRAIKKEQIIRMAERYNKTPAQIILKWCMQSGVMPIVKSSNRERMRSNLDLDFTISDDHMQCLNDLPYMGSSGLDSETITLFG